MTSSFHDSWYYGCAASCCRYFSSRSQVCVWLLMMKFFNIVRIVVVSVRFCHGLRPSRQQLNRQNPNTRTDVGICVEFFQSLFLAFENHHPNFEFKFIFLIPRAIQVKAACNPSQTGYDHANAQRELQRRGQGTSTKSYFRRNFDPQHTEHRWHISTVCTWACW